MSRIAKWKLEKTKVKVVFRLQFYATHIPQTGWDKLFISFIPSDSGKATAKTTKANVRNGTCKWADPIYETTRLLQDAKSKQYDEKLYKLVVAMGSSRSSILGEATINLADYADSLKPSTVSLPLQGCNSGTVLHVNVQLLTSKTGFREFEQQREVRERGLQSGDENKHDDGSPGKDIASDEPEKFNASVQFQDAKDLSSLEEVGSHEEHEGSALGFDDSSNTSGSSGKHDNSSTHVTDGLRSTVSDDLIGHSHYASQQAEKGDPSNDQIMVQGTSYSVHGWASDHSIDNDLAMVCEENHELRGSLELAESTIFELKQEIDSLQIQANEIGTETQRFSHFLVSEVSSGEEMAKEVSILKSECSKFKDDIEMLKIFKMNPQVTGRDYHAEHEQLLQDKQLKWINGILSVENRMRELQKKTYLSFHETDFGSFHSEIEELLSMLQDIGQGAAEALCFLSRKPLERIDVEEIRGTYLFKNDKSSSGTELDLDLSLPDSLLQHLGIPPLFSQADSTGAIDAMKSKIFYLIRELDEAKSERENCIRKMDQMECYYEALVQELEENNKQILGELQNLRNEHSTCLYTISACKAEMESMHQDMSYKLLNLAEERSDLDALNKELERRATTSEAALRRARLNYSIAVHKLQKDLELLSSQVVSMFETNQNLIKQAFSGSHQQILGSLKTSQNPEDSEARSFSQDQNLNAGVREQPLGGDILQEDLKKSLYMQKELNKNLKEELHEMQFVNLHLDIFSKTLQETLRQANADIGIKENCDELVKHLDLANKAQDQLIIRLQTAMEDIHILNNDKASCIAKFGDMAQTLETKLEIVTKENGLLSQKVAEFERIKNESRSYWIKYEACCVEKLGLSNLLKQENIENVKLHNEISLLKEELKRSEAKLVELSLLKDNLQEHVSFAQDKLANILASYDQQFKGLNLLNNFDCLHLEVHNFKGTILQLEEMQFNAFNRILQLMEEKKGLDGERVLSETSLSTARAEILSLKQKFKSDIQRMAAKFDASNTVIEKLQSDLESVVKKIHLTLEVEEEYGQQSKEILVDLALFEVELQKLTSKGGLLTQEIMGLEGLAEELGRSKSTIAELIQEKQWLLVSLQDKIQESSELKTERDSLFENFRSLNDELEAERTIKEKLGGTVRDLTSHLNKIQEKLIDYDQQQAELVHFRQLLSQHEIEKSSLTCISLEHDKCLEKLQDKSSRITGLQTQLAEMDEDMLAADVKLTFLLNQFTNLQQEFVQHIKLLDGCFGQLQKKHHEVEAMLNHRLVHEAHYIEENAKLMMNLESLRSDLEASRAQSKFFSDANNVIRVQLEECNEKLKVLESGYITDKDKHHVQVEQLKTLLADAENEIHYLILSKEELEITMTILKDKLDEQSARLSSMEEYKDGVVMLQSQCTELTHKLSEQVLKADEFENLSIHLKELKDKAEAECHLAHEKREPERPPAVQQSSIVAFIKEQYETRFQEMRQQLVCSQEHGEELLLKLQDALDEIENRKKSEASYLKRNEELSLKLLQLEAHLQSALSEECQEIKGCDSVNAELDSAVLTLECCKEEKEKIEGSLRECKGEKNKIAVELTRSKGQLENIALSEENGRIEKAGDVLDELTGNLLLDSTNAGTSIYKETVEHASSVQDVEFEDSSASLKEQAGQEAATKGFCRMNQDILPGGDIRQSDEELLYEYSVHPNTMNFRSSVAHLHDELERMKNKNYVLPNDHDFDTDSQVLQGEIMRLHKANEELRNIFPWFSEISSGGNALETVLALEIELAEILRAKSKSKIHCQSDEESILTSIGGINVLIKETLELRGRYAALENELKQMHDRYSKLSLQFAEVEGENQQLKNVAQASRNFIQLNHTLSDTMSKQSS